MPITPLKSFRFPIVLLILIWVVSGCAALETRPDAPEKMLADSIAMYNSKNYGEAISHLTLLLEEYPDSAERVEALLLLANCHFLFEQYQEAKFHYQRFIELYPAHPKSDQAMYYRALCDFQMMDIATRDQTSAENALKGFQKVIDEHPRSPYADKAREKKQACLESLARSQMEIARFYFRTSSYLSAINRIKTIIEKYPDQSFLDEAFFLLGESYYNEQNYEGARKYYVQLVKKYPRSPFVREARARLREIP